MKKWIILFTLCLSLFSCWEEQASNIEQTPTDNTSIVQESTAQITRETTIELKEEEQQSTPVVIVEDTVDQTPDVIPEEEIVESIVEVTPVSTMQPISSLSDMLQTCRSECWSDAKSYCTEEKTFKNNGSTITGTCRSYAKYNPGFRRCEWFCKPFGQNTIRCTNADGSVNMRCN